MFTKIIKDIPPFQFLINVDSLGGKNTYKYVSASIGIYNTNLTVDDLSLLRSTIRMIVSGKINSAVNIQNVRITPCRVDKGPGATIQHYNPECGWAESSNNKATERNAAYLDVLATDLTRLIAKLPFLND